MMATEPTPRTWTGSVNNDASNPGNWSPVGVPQPGDMLTDAISRSTIDIRDNALAGNTLAIAGTETTLNLSHLARADVSVQNFAFGVVANVSGVDTLNASVAGFGFPSEFPGQLTVNLDHAILFGSFNVAADAEATVTSNDHSLLIDNQTNAVSGGSLGIDADVLGNGTFNLTPVRVSFGSVVGAHMAFRGFVSGGETVSVTGSNLVIGPFPGISSVEIDQPKDFHGTVDLHDMSLAGLVGLAQADSWSYKNDLLSIKAANGKVIDRLHVISDASSTGSGVHGLMVSKTAAGAVLVSPGTDFSGTLASQMT
jgi:hypothetical protein